MPDVSQIPYEKLTIIGFLVFALYGAIKGWWVPGYIYRETVIERDKQTRLASELVEHAKKVTDGWLPRPEDNERAL